MLTEVSLKVKEIMNFEGFRTSGTLQTLLLSAAQRLQAIFVPYHTHTQLPSNDSCLTVYPLLQQKTVSPSKLALPAMGPSSPTVPKPEPALLNCVKQILAAFAGLDIRSLLKKKRS